MDQDNELLEISGTVDTVIYKNEENGYTVLRLLDENGERVTVVGTFPYAAPGETMIISGGWMNHSVHGRQFKAEFAQRLMPQSAHAIYEYLASGTVRGIGPATRFGERARKVGGDQGYQPAEGQADVFQFPQADRCTASDGVYLFFRPASDPGDAAV